MTTYNNPVLKGFYPDPSVCFADGKFYMVCSSFQYFPGVPLFESDDLVNWTQIGHVLTRRSQVVLDGAGISGGVYAPTIRYNNGRFYMVTTNTSVGKNFYVYTDDIHAEWSEPIFVEQDGIDPSLYFEDRKIYFMSNGTDDEGNGGIVQSEINIETGEKLSPTRRLWGGNGGKFLESPHLYKINGSYYLMAAEGGTEYGHMITYARGESVWGPFEGYENNPVLTNRNQGMSMIQAIGHGDLICDEMGNWHIISLGFRQCGTWAPYHILGREVFLTPVQFNEDGWFTAGTNGTTVETYENKYGTVQQEKKLYTFDNTDWKLDWCFMRHPVRENYEFGEDFVVLHGTDDTLETRDKPTFIGIRQRDFEADITADIEVTDGEGGLTLFMAETEHYDVAVRKTESGYEAVLKLNIGSIKHTEKVVPLSSGNAKLVVHASHYTYNFGVESDGVYTELGFGFTKYLSSEVAGGFTGVVIGLYAIGGTSKFTDFECRYK